MKRITAILLALLVVIAVPVMAYAAKSPAGETKVSVEASSSNATQGTVEKTVNADGSVKLVAKPAAGYEFKNWTITAKTSGGAVVYSMLPRAIKGAAAVNTAAEAPYTIVSGSLNEATIVIKPTVDVVVVANFSGKSASGSGSATSPKSGESIALLVLACTLSLAGAGYAVKKAIA